MSKQPGETAWTAFVKEAYNGHCGSFATVDPRAQRAWAKAEEAAVIAGNPALQEALKDVLASLVAAHSLLSRGGKKAAPSNTMFEIMLSDYAKSIERGRAALGIKVEPEGEDCD